MCSPQRRRPYLGTGILLPEGRDKYIELETGIYIPEVSVDEQGNVKKLVPIRYKNRLKEVIKK